MAEIQERGFLQPVGKIRGKHWYLVVAEVDGTQRFLRWKRDFGQKRQQVVAHVQLRQMHTEKLVICSNSIVIW